MRIHADPDPKHWLNVELNEWKGCNRYRLDRKSAFSYPVPACQVPDTAAGYLDNYTVVLSNMSFYILETRIRSSLFLNGTGKRPETQLYQICIVSSYVHGISSILLQISWISPDRLRIAQKKTSALHIGRKNWNSVTGGSWTTLFDRQAVCFRRAKEAGGQIKWAVP